MNEKFDKTLPTRTFKTKDGVFTLQYNPQEGELVTTHVRGKPVVGNKVHMDADGTIYALIDLGQDKTPFHWEDITYYSGSAAPLLWFVAKAVRGDVSKERLQVWEFSKNEKDEYSEKPLAEEKQIAVAPGQALNITKHDMTLASPEGTLNKVGHFFSAGRLGVGAETELGMALRDKGLSEPWVQVLGSFGNPSALDIAAYIATLATLPAGGEGGLERICLRSSHYTSCRQ